MLFTRKKAGFAFLITSLGICFLMGCGSYTPAIVNSNTKDIKVKDFEGPNGNNALVFGVFDAGVYFVQINPDLDPLYIFPGSTDGRRSSVRFTQPVAVGSSLQLAYLYTSSSAADYYSRPGLQMPDAPYNIRVTKPGLHYAGSFICKIVGEGFIRLGDSLEFVEDTGKTELDALTLMIDQFKDTAWGPVINARIEELKNGK